MAFCFVFIRQKYVFTMTHEIKFREVPILKENNSGLITNLNRI